MIKKVILFSVWFVSEGFVLPQQRDGGRRIERNVVVPDWVGDLGIQLAETVITWSVPIAGGVLVASSFKGDKDEGLAGRRRELEIEFGLEDESDTLSLFKGGPPGFGPGRKLKRNRSPTPSYLKIERLNDRLESYSFDLKAAEIGRFAALKEKRRSRLQRAFRDEVNITALSENDLKTLGMAEISYKQAAFSARESAKSARSLLRALAVSGRPETMMEATMGEAGDQTEEKIDQEKAEGGSDKTNQGKIKTNPMSMMNTLFEQRGAEQKLQEAILQEARAEAAFLAAVASVITEKNAQTRITQLVFASRGDNFFIDDTVSNTTSSSLFSDNGSSSHAQDAAAAANRVFVLNFNGDVTASQTRQLRQEITALLQVAKENTDEVVLRLSTGGGTVTGYGSAAGQLTRLKNAGLKLTVCVEEVAASGGYLMACAADHLIASPFAVLGSIGVISDIPNVYERLRREGVEFQTVTAGKYKRTVTPTKKVTGDDLAKSKADLEDVLKLFKAWVAENRPSLDIDNVATGETWYGEKALEKGLCDELRTFDDVIIDKLHAGAQVFSITYRDPKPSPTQLLGDFSSLVLDDDRADLSSFSPRSNIPPTQPLSILFFRDLLLRALLAISPDSAASVSSDGAFSSSSPQTRGRDPDNFYMLDKDTPFFF